MTYRRRATPLHAARAGIAATYCLVLGLAALLAASPVTLAAVAVAAAGAAVAAGAGRETLRALRFALPVAVLICLVNALVSRSGVTVIARLGDLPLYGQTNVTLEATVAGAMLGLRALTLVLIATFYATSVDPDELLRLMRRLSFRSALTATLATRLVPVLARDAGRLADARRCRPGRPPTRAQLMRATTAGVLDRALDVAAALEVRGYSRSVSPSPSPSLSRSARAARGRRRDPVSRHDLAFIASATALASIAVAARVAGLARFSTYPSLEMPMPPSEIVCAVAILLAAWLPFLDRRGVAP